MTSPNTVVAGTQPAPPAVVANDKKSFIKAIFTPNAVLSASVYKMVLMVEVGMLVVGWLFAPSFLPSPTRVLTALTDLINNQGLIEELLVSLVLNLQAIAVSTVIAMFLSYAAAIPAFKPLVTAISKGRFLSMIGLSFVLTMILGGGHQLKLGMLSFSITVFFITSMLDVVLQVPDANLDYIRTLRANEWRVLLEARVWDTLDVAFDIMRQNAAIGWMMLTMVESMVRGEGGIGRLLSDQEKHFSLDAIFAVQAVFLLVGIGQDLFIGWLKTIFAPWSTLTYQAKK